MEAERPDGEERHGRRGRSTAVGRRRERSERPSTRALQYFTLPSTWQISTPGQELQHEDKKRTSSYEDGRPRTGTLIGPRPHWTTPWVTSGTYLQNAVDKPLMAVAAAFKWQNESERRRSSVVLSIPGLEVFPGDLLVSDGASDYMYQASWLPNSDAKKPKWPFSKKASFIKGKQKQSSDLENCLLMFKVSDFREYKFTNIKDKPWDEIRNTQNIDNNQIIRSSNRKRQEAIWELFTSECTYFLEHLLVLKRIFFHTLRHLQNNDHLLDVDAVRLFGNLEELNQESLNFATSLFNTIESEELGFTTSFSLSLTDLLTKYFKDKLCLSHQIYCLNYTSAIIYLETLKQRDDFATYLKWCEQQEQCRRLHLTDLLVAPLHRLTRYPLLLKKHMEKK
ncbi:unnamed protein product [Ranitomeya imitator]|uniref:DH domain-containing protein n=1 Tax=Ranitomeya imitator TaxID=111125 RepID=A0ABN9LHW0_9NEOB|nr:unnamed protein product [Ranitomeya imitator]